MDAITSLPQAAIVKPKRTLPVKMTHAAGEAGADDPPVLHAAIELAEQIREASNEIERGRRLPPDIAAAMKAAGVFGMAMPRVWGGPELDPLTQFRVIEALAMADGSVGWCAMIGCEGGYVTGFLDQDVARAMYPDILVATGAAATTTSKAVRVPGGYRVSGRFPFVSGCQHCEWLWAGCTVIENGVPRVDGNGVPETRQCLMRLSQCEILDTWHTIRCRPPRDRRRDRECSGQAGAALHGRRWYRGPQDAARRCLCTGGRGARRDTPRGRAPIFSTLWAICGRP
jgi:hypothetical protein